MRTVALVAGSLMFFVAISYFLHGRATGDVKPANALGTAQISDPNDTLKKKLS